MLRGAVASAPLSSAPCPAAQGCGGDMTGWPGEISCTPFWLNVPVCDYNEPVLVTESGARGWSAGGYDEFFVFHQCDGAGVQTDCVGSQYYVEYFGPIIEWEQGSCKCVPECDGNGDCTNTQYDSKPDGIDYFVPCVPWEDQDNTDELYHTQCQFTHPGTGITYGEYMTGQWGYLADGETPPPVMLANIDCNDGQDCQGKVDYSDVCPLAVGDLPSFPEHPYGDADLKIYVRLENWVCHTQPNDPFNEQYTGSPHINCLSDNEVWNTNHADTELPKANPPQRYLYVGVYNNGGDPYMKVSQYDVCGNFQSDWDMQPIDF
jgi:hypothetical protein